MNRWLSIAAGLLIAGCASSSYRYDDDGYWLSAPRAPTVVVSVGWGGCGAWGGPYGHPWFGYGYGYPPGYGWLACGYGYGAWYGAGYGYWRDPWWGQPWYLPPRTIGPHPAGERARRMARQPTEDLIAVPRYDDLATSRRRDLGSGGLGSAPYAGGRGGIGQAPAAMPSRGGIGSAMRGATAPAYPAPPQGLSGARIDSGAMLPGSPRSSFESRSGPSSGSIGRSAQPRSAPSAPRSQSRESREEQ